MKKQHPPYPRCDVGAAPYLLLQIKYFQSGVVLKEQHDRASTHPQIWINGSCDYIRLLAQGGRSRYGKHRLCIDRSYVYLPRDVYVGHRMERLQILPDKRIT